MIVYTHWTYSAVTDTRRSRSDRADQLLARLPDGPLQSGNRLVESLRRIFPCKSEGALESKAPFLGFNQCAFARTESVRRRYVGVWAELGDNHPSQGTPPMGQPWEEPLESRYAANSIAIGLAETLCPESRSLGRGTRFKW